MALTVLDIIDDEDLLGNATTTGESLGDAMNELSRRHELIGAVQGSGLFWGLDLVADRATRRPIAYADAKRLVTELRRRGILAGITGRHNNVLKIRPPLVFRPEHVDLLAAELGALLDGFELRGGTDVKAPGAEW